MPPLSPSRLASWLAVSAAVCAWTRNPTSSARGDRPVIRPAGLGGDPQGRFARAQLRLPETIGRDFGARRQASQARGYCRRCAARSRVRMGPTVVRMRQPDWVEGSHPPSRLRQFRVRCRSACRPRLASSATCTAASAVSGFRSRCWTCARTALACSGVRMTNRILLKFLARDPSRPGPCRRRVKTPRTPPAAQRRRAPRPSEARREEKSGACSTPAPHGFCAGATRSFCAGHGAGSTGRRL